MKPARVGVVLLGLLVAACVFWTRLPPGLLERERARAVDVRGLAFLDPVSVKWIEANEIREVVESELRELLPPEYLEDYEAAYRALGVLPPGSDLLESLLDLNVQELAGLYSPNRDRMYVLREFAQHGEDGPGVVVHELVHALQDQHFPSVFALLQGLRHDDDVVAALSAVLEGDASLAALPLPQGSEDAGAARVHSAEAMRDAMLRELEDASPSRIPLLLRASLIFPYAYGTVLAARAYEARATKGLDGLLLDPPLATRDLIEESREPVEFVRFPLEAMESELAKLGCALGHHNVAGALTLQVLFQAHAGEELPRELLSDWRGDRFLHVRCAAENQLFFVIRFARASSAADFARRYAAFAPSLAEWAGYRSPPRAFVRERDVVIATAKLAGRAEAWHAASAFRPFATLSDWIAAGCTGEPACPEVFSSLEVRSRSMLAHAGRR